MQSTATTRKTFQSTPSAWRETKKHSGRWCKQRISIHSLRMEGDLVLSAQQFAQKISIHSLRMEGDIAPSPRLIDTPGFQSTPSAWRETSLRVPSDTASKDFNPLPPHGGRRPCAAGLPAWDAHFNPLPPHGGRPTGLHSAGITDQNFNPLPPHGGRRRRNLGKNASWNAFQSTPSAWRETSAWRTASKKDSFQSTPSAWRETSL